MSRPAVYTPPYRPYAHQQEALDLLARPENAEAFALFMGMRTGKTKVVLDDYGRRELAGECQDLAVIAPGGVYKTWEKAIFGDPAVPGDRGHLSDDLRSRMNLHVWESGAGVTKRRKLGEFLENIDRPRAFLINVEALSSVKEAKAALLAFLRRRKAKAVIDESIIIKNPSSNRTKFINGDVADAADFRRLLSGLPNPKDPLDYFSQMYFLNWRYLGFKSYFAMRGRYAVLWNMDVGGRTVPVIKGWKDLDDLERRLKPHCYRKQLKDCHDTPPKAYMFHDVEMTPEQARIYKDMKEYATAQLDAESHVTATVVIAQITRLRQILCGFTKDEAGVVHRFPENRTQGVLDRLIGYDGKAIIWCAFGESIEAVSKALREEYGDASVAQFWGGNQATREHDEYRFKSDPECRFMVATAAAGGRGRTWTVADLIIYHSNSDDLDHRDQSEERGSGIGKDERITVVDLRCGPMDNKIITNLRNKIDLATSVNGEGYRAWLI